MELHGILCSHIKTVYNHRAIRVMLIFNSARLGKNTKKHLYLERISELVLRDSIGESPPDSTNMSPTYNYMIVFKATFPISISEKHDKDFVPLRDSMREVSETGNLICCKKSLTLQPVLCCIASYLKASARHHPINDRIKTCGNVNNFICHQKAGEYAFEDYYVGHITSARISQRNGAVGSMLDVVFLQTKLRCTEGSLDFNQSAVSRSQIKCQTSNILDSIAVPCPYSNVSLVAEETDRITRKVYTSHGARGHGYARNNRNNNADDDAEPETESNSLQRDLRGTDVDAEDAGDSDDEDDLSDGDNEGEEGMDKNIWSMTGVEWMDSFLVIWHAGLLILSVFFLVIGLVLRFFFSTLVENSVKSSKLVDLYSQFVKIDHIPSYLSFGSLTTVLGDALLVSSILYIACVLMYMTYMFHKIPFTLPLVIIISNAVVLVEVNIINIYMSPTSEANEAARLKLKTLANEEYAVGSHNPFAVTYDIISIWGKCCGIVDQYDFQNVVLKYSLPAKKEFKTLQVPPTCCKQGAFLQGVDAVVDCATKAEGIHTKGCYSVLYEWLREYCNYYSIVIVLQLLDVLIHIFIYKKHLRLLDITV